MRKDGVLQAEVEMLVPFFDVDSMDVVWHGHYVKYFEVARCALLERIGHNYQQMRDAGYAWPIIDVQLRYMRGARFNQRIVVRADLVEWENRLKINYLIRDAETGERMTRGSTVQVAVEIASREMLLASPRVFVDAVERALA
ncbi:MAG TPA: acyl-CoA thioesterase [Pseudomonas sp.]|jgi:acyl-CoA thioester hydrolase|uniref:Acyl-CoA thioesterase n=3 Tax=Stutzerimonas stutzeri group TaxID=136846 RepID=A0A0H3YVT1_STUST|nr:MULTISPECIES: acyl-CoA thioesterase [Pseudomonadaceae]MAL91965.1 thioesterase [Pseudomonas sp.]MCJ0877288.1 acyl-CoA thioesterase [Pseudomonas sp. JI-2]MEC7475009.1 acyl-CoA thioesterase [Pseudomonadota bacterium]OCX91736.1 MAG: thioesterase [Pseudomonas sp. CO183]AGA88173.1 putative thioesterase [Stutzerimonas stutzeri RCH2]|tara:strand:- start:614 stop:1039 length:426 start_codon:yes stop_codon:yes gene_type:complete